MSAQRRRAPVPLPIFNKSKRPRKALLAHPNNVGGPAQTQWKNSYVAPSPSPSSAWHGDLRNGDPYAANSGQHGRDPHFNYPPKLTPQYAYRSAEQQENLQPGVMSTMSRDSQHLAFTTHQAGQSHSGQTYSTSASLSHRPSSEPKTGAWRGQHTMQVAKADPSSRGPSPRSKLRKSVRVLTATAKGMEHWSRYRHLTQVIFEVYGVLCTTVTLGDTGAKEFTLRTTDGPVKCVFWEMDRSLPHLIRGHMHRVVGLWDNQKRFLKCYSVRPARGKEEECAGEFVRASDHSMRETVATAHEN